MEREEEQQPPMMMPVMAEPVRLPQGVCEVLPGLYVGPEAAVGALIQKHGLRHVVRCMESSPGDYDYDRFLPSKFVTIDRAELAAGDGALEEQLHQTEKGEGEEECDDGKAEQGKTAKTDETSAKAREEEATEGNDQQKSRVEEVKDEDEEKAKNKKKGDAQEADGSQEKHDDKSKPSDEATAAAERTQEDEEAEEADEAAAAHEARFVTVRDHVRTAHAPMEDTLDFPLLEHLPKALDAVDAMLVSCGATLQQEEKPEEEDDEQEDWMEDADEDDAAAAAMQSGKAPPPPAAASTSASAPQQQQQQQQQADNASATLLRHAVYVHCSAGSSRSPAVVLGFLLTRKDVPLAQGLGMIPPAARPNPNFIRQLVQLEEMLTGDSSSLDLDEYMLDGLKDLFPQLQSEAVEEAYERCGQDVAKARQVLMRKAMTDPAVQDQMMVSALYETTQKRIDRDVVEKVFVVECKRNRAEALKKLTELCALQQGQRNGDGEEGEAMGQAS